VRPSYQLYFYDYLSTMLQCMCAVIRSATVYFTCSCQIGRCEVRTVGIIGVVCKSQDEHKIVMNKNGVLS
jgi:hypothetical protein